MVPDERRGHADAIKGGEFVLPDAFARPRIWRALKALALRPTWGTDMLLQVGLGIYRRPAPLFIWRGESRP